MKTIVFSLIALSVVVGLVNPVSAFDPKIFWEEQESSGPAAFSADPFAPMRTHAPSLHPMRSMARGVAK